MNRILLALCLLPTAALAGSFNFTNKQTGGICTQMIGSSSCHTGTFVSGTISSLLSAPIDITVVGTLNTIEFTIRDLSCSSMTMCTFTQMGAQVFHNGVAVLDFGGMVTGTLIRMGNTAEMNASVETVFTLFFDGSYSGNTLTSGSAYVTFPQIQQIPEPGALELLGIGLLGIAVSLRPNLLKIGY